MSKHTNEVEVTEKLLVRSNIPEDYHCTCKYCTGNFLGEIYDVKNDKYYSNFCRRSYYDMSLPKHIAPGHFQLYRWSVQNLINESCNVFDPTVGTGTAIVEAINHGRNGIGIELEYPDITIGNIKFQYTRENDKPTGKYLMIHGNAKDLKRLLIEKGVKEKSIQLIVNGPPYLTEGGKSSDAPERKNINTGRDDTFDYANNESFGKLSGEKYWEMIMNMYLDCIPFMKKGAKLVFAIKDLVRNKKAYLLHKMVVDNLLEKTNELKYYGCIIHKHIPQTFTMRTYRKRFPEVKIPLYQTGIILEKI